MMPVAIAVLVGVLYSIGIYLILRRSLVKTIIGLALLGNATNLLIFTAAGLTPGQPAIVTEGEKALTQPYADPVPQALILTAIVISFGVLAFGIVLIKRVYEAFGTDDPDSLREGDEI